MHKTNEIAHRNDNLFKINSRQAVGVELQKFINITEHIICLRKMKYRLVLSPEFNYVVFLLPPLLLVPPYLHSHSLGYAHYIHWIHINRPHTHWPRASNVKSTKFKLQRKAMK